MQGTGIETNKDISENKDECIASITPWEVKGKVNYMAQINKFGTNAIESNLIKRWEHVTKMKAHTFLRRGLVFSHQDLNKILDCVENGVPIYIYTGRGPSSDSMHLGHMVPFLFTRYLQKALNCIVVIQMSDDEKFLFKNGSKAVDLEAYHKLSYKNARDIIACGFELDKTLIFSNLEFNSDYLYFNNVLIMKSTTMNQIKGTYGLGETTDPIILDLVKTELKSELEKESPDTDKVKAYEKLVKNDNNSNSSSNLGQCVWPAFQCGPAFASSFTDLFAKALKHALISKGDEMPTHVEKNMKKILGELLTLDKPTNMMCLVPMAIDQAPYFRMARDVAQTLNHPKPAIIHSEFLPGLKQSSGKMSSTTGGDNSTLFLDMDPKKVGKIIKKHAFSGGGETLEEHKKNGGNIKVDICYQYLTYFLDDDKQLHDIAIKYSSGEMTSGELKSVTADLISNLIAEHQVKKNTLTNEDVEEYFDWNRVLNIGGCYDRVNLTDNLYDNSDYDKIGINFDRTFGLTKDKETE
jgi:tryptophanyl-tRNA synthetase